MTPEELKETIASTLSSFRDEVKSEIEKALAPKDEDETVEFAKASDLETLSAEIKASVEAALTPITETVDGLTDVVDKMLDKFEALAKRSVVKRSIETNDESGTEQAPTLKSSMVAALNGQKVELV